MSQTRRVDTSDGGELPVTFDLAIEYDEEFERHVVDYDDDRQPSEVIVYTVAEISDTEATALRPLGNVVDPDALDTIFDRFDGESHDAHLSFQYEGYEVTVFSTGRLTVSEPVDHSGV